MQKSTESRILDLIFPRSCIHCSTLLSSDHYDTYLCGPCRTLMPQNTVSRCAFCPRAVTLWQTCSACRSNHSLDRLLVASDYRDRVIERMVKALKYRFAYIVSHDIGTFMAEYLAQRASLIGLAPDSVLVTSVPLHPRRLRWRGFNQAELIAHTLASSLEIPEYHELITRTRHTTPQADIEDRTTRTQNAEHLFDINRSIQVPKNKTILLIDDVATTGATLDNAARVLKNAGVKKVIGFVFARG